ncbi:unnamed protein product [Adineta ricciae]|uniref:Uncharacterized protein n=1 Tax=Adineta ricciae TaxID=249248 RepID=A0A815WUP2_ADIRI|nr:unnamed protein product [Adineta ricciae]CAF1660358.1 unnamed protein product [Adineta ricciae]
MNGLTASSSSDEPIVARSQSTDGSEEQRKRKRMLEEKAARLFGYSLSESYLHARYHRWSAEQYRSLRQTPVLVNYSSPLALELGRLTLSSPSSSSSSPPAAATVRLEFDLDLFEQIGNDGVGNGSSGDSNNVKSN